MLFRLSHIDLSRRLAGHFVLFATAALVWVVVSTATVTWLIMRHNADQYCRQQLDEAALIITVDDLAPTGKILASSVGSDPSRTTDPAVPSKRILESVPKHSLNDGKNLQSKVERFRSQGDLEYCAVVAMDGKIWAHSSADLVGQMLREPAGEYTDLGQVSRLRFSPANSETPLIEYRCPVRKGRTEFASLHVAVAEPSLWQAIEPAFDYAFAILLGPLALMSIGTFVVAWKVRPLSGIANELGRVRTAISPANIDLNEVRAFGPAAAGWNRLVHLVRELEPRNNAQQRIERGLQALLGQQGLDVLNSLPEGFAITDREGRISFANRALSALCQGPDTDEDLAGREMEACLGLDRTDPAVAALLHPAAQSRHSVAEIRRTLNGSDQFLRVARCPLRREDGQTGSGYVWTTRDVTQQKLSAQMRDQFLHTATHELRTPLANIKAYAETLDIEDELDMQKQKQFLNIISSEATRLARLVDDLLDISSMEVGSLALQVDETDIQRVFSEVVDKVQAEIDKKEIQFITNYPAKWPKIHLDKDKITTSLVNVVGNAIKYTPPGGRVTLEVQIEGSDLTVRVDDTGVGIAPRDLPHVFDKFYRSSDARVQDEVGSGLGLSLVKEVIRLHGGTVSVKSDETQPGTQFTIKLPVR
jgi:signal transduction histidine kinase